MASYNPPNPYVPGAFNPTQFVTPSANITTKYLDENYLRFPFAQGTENFVSINNQGSLNQGGLADFSSNTTPAIFNLPPTITNPILDTATTPLNAVATIGYVLANEQGGGDLLPLNNLWTGVNNFNPNPIQPYGGVMSQGITLTNNQNSSTPSGENDIISYTPSSTQGLCIFSSSTNSVIGKTAQIELQPDGVKTSLFANGTNGVVQLNALGGTQSKIILQASSGVFLQLTPSINFNNWGTLSTTSGTSGLVSNVNITLPAQTTYTPSTTYGDVGATQQFVQLALASQGGGDAVLAGNNVFTGSNTFSYNSNGGPITASGLTLARNVEVGYNELDLVSINSTSSSGLFIYCESGSVSSASTPKIQIYNDGTATLFNTNVTLPAQATYTPSITYGNVGATQQFVQQALASQGGGDAVLAGNNTFTGINTFSSTVQTSTLQTFPQLSSNQFASLAYVNNLGETQGSNFFNISSPQLGGGVTITYSSPNSPNNAGGAQYFSNAGVGGTVYTYVSTTLFCTIIQNNLSPINNCLFTLTFSTGTPPTTANENMSLRVINGGTQYTLPLTYTNNQFTTSNPISLITSQGYKFYIQGSYI